jgi:THO complex subunit 3
MPPVEKEGVASTKKLDELLAHFKGHSKVKEYQAHSSKVHSVGWSCDGTRLASGSFDKQVNLFLLDKDRLVRL